MTDFGPTAARRVPDEKLTPERAVRLLRAKAGELEHRVLVEAETLDEPMTTLGLNMLVNGMMADTALIATLLADFMERSQHSPNITQEMLDSRRPYPEPTWPVENQKE